MFRMRQLNFLRSTQSLLNRSGNLLCCTASKTSNMSSERNGHQAANVERRIDEIEGFQSFKNLGTIATHVGHVPLEHDGTGCPVIPPITLSTTFEQREPGVAVSFLYSKNNIYHKAYSLLNISKYHFKHVRMYCNYNLRIDMICY